MLLDDRIALYCGPTYGAGWTVRTTALSAPRRSVAEKGCRLKTSSFIRPHVNTSMTKGKITGQYITAKDFRTWAGTLAAARALCLIPKATSATEAKRNVNTCVKAVAGLLGNTAAVCRGSYIHPLVLASYQQGVLPLKPGRSERAFELATIRFLEAAQASCAEA